MRVLPSSPRRRRRFIRLGIAVAVTVAIAAILGLVHGGKAPNPAPPKSALPAQVAQRSTKVTRSERRAIDWTLDHFLRAGLDGSAPATAWRLAGPEMKAGSSLREWRAGTSPIPHVPTRETTFHGWTVDDAGPHHVVFDHLVVHPRHGPRTTSWILAGEVVKRGSNWLVNGLYTIAIMRPHQVGPADFAAPPVSSEPAPRAASGTLGKEWLLVVGGLLGLALLFPLGYAVVSGVRSRRSRRRFAQGRQELPPLPHPSGTRSDPVGAGAGGRTRS
jgi:hypothetical protein